MRRSLFVLLGLAITVPAQAAPPSPAPSKAPPYGLPALGRADFNRLAVKAELPLFWKDDGQNPGVPDVNELAVVGDTKLARFVGKDGLALTKDFEKAYRQLVELRRREAVERELAQGRPTLVETNLTTLSAEEQKIVTSLMGVRQQIDALYQTQTGAAPLAKKVARDDVASRALFQRNQSARCEAPLTQDDPFCSAVPDFAEQVVDVWPALQGEVIDAAFCERVAKDENAKELTAPFTVVRKKKDRLVATPYHKHYAGPMKAIAATLEKTAKLVKSDNEAAFKAYLLAAAKGFRTDDWEAADEAWSKMNAENSRFYLRIGPDETYWDPCQLKAGFHMSFALVDKEALAWKQKLSAIRKDLEDKLAALIGAPYVARAVSFELPEFIEIIVNAGDSRSALGATIGQSLPNFGRVAAESRGRTVAMANLYTDADSRADFAAKDKLLWTEATLVFSSDDPALDQLGTVLHEATHNLGPYGSTLIDGKRPQEIFGGQVDAILEELKSQTGALWFMLVLRDKGMMTADEVKRGWLASLSWAFGHIAQGMFDGDGHPKTYSQLSAIQFGELMRAGAIKWVDSAGDSKDGGRFEVDFDKLEPAVTELMRVVGRIKATGDVAGAKALIERNVSDEGLVFIKAGVIRERILRFSKASFVYGLSGG